MTAADPALLRIRNLYVLPMAGGLDQYLANRLTRNGRYTVVTDPAQADALLTDQVGMSFETKMRELYPPPPAPSEPKEKAPVKPGEQRSMVSLMGEASASAGARVSTFSRGKGNVFLVERASKTVVWSTYLPVKSKSSNALNRVADDIVDRLDDDAEDFEKAGLKAAMKAPTTVVTKPVAVPPAPAPAK